VHINRRFLALCRTIHIYLTMFGLLVLLGFGITGFTINHEDWFAATRPKVSEVEGKTPLELIAKKDSAQVVSYLRQTFHIAAALASYDDLDERLSVGFKSPGEIWEIQIDKTSGKTAVHAEQFNWVAIVNNLHRGRYSGAAWSWVIDASAVLIVLACLTGIVMWLALPKRLKLGTAFLVLGTLAVIMTYLILVPGSDAK
jgi:hypothetical protein